MLERRIGDHAMKKIPRKSSALQPVSETVVICLTTVRPIGSVRDRVRTFIQAMVEGELNSA
jgi:hypothetical protein